MSIIVKRMATERSHRCHVYHELPEWFSSSTGEHIPQRVVHSARCDMDDTLLGANPVWNARQS